VVAAIPVSDYLSSVYDPDVDFVEGELEDRHVGDEDHAKLQRRVVQLFDTGKWLVTSGTRIRISPTRYRVPDVCVYDRGAPWIVIEVLSPEDRMSRMQRKIEDYYTASCPNIWILDPWLRKAYRFDGTSMVQVSELATDDGRVHLSFSQLF
jgi:Uma2 family endonuclease